MKQILKNIKHKLSQLSYRTGIIVLCFCVVCYAISFLQMLLPFSTTTKGVLWFAFFGIAKGLQYTAILILGTVGISRIKSIISRYRRR